MIRTRITTWALRAVALGALTFGLFALVRLAQNDPTATDAVVAIGALASSIAAVLALLQSAETADQQMQLAQRAADAEVRRALPLLGLATPEERADGTFVFSILNDTPSTAIDVTLSIEVRGIDGSVSSSSAQTWSAIPASERKRFTVGGVPQPYDEIVMRLSCGGILGGSIMQTWVAGWEGKTFARRFVEISPRLEPG